MSFRRLRLLPVVVFARKERRILCFYCVGSCPLFSGRPKLAINHNNSVLLTFRVPLGLVCVYRSVCRAPLLHRILLNFYERPHRPGTLSIQYIPVLIQDNSAIILRSYINIYIERFGNWWWRVNKTSSDVFRFVPGFYLYKSIYSNKWFSCDNISNKTQHLRSLGSLH